MEKVGVDAFVEGGFFKGDLYLDEGKKIYKEMQFKRYNMLTVAGALLTSDFRKKNAKSNAMGIKGDMKGDGMQLGGTLVVSKGGEKLLLCHKQTNPGDHTNTEEVLKSLGIAAAKETGTAEAEAGPEAGQGEAAAAEAAESNEIACECDAEEEKKDDAKTEEASKDSEAAKTAPVETKETAKVEGPETIKAEAQEKEADDPGDTAAVEEDKAEGVKDEGSDGEAKGDAPKE